MPSTTSAAIDERGFLFHLPKLGLSDPAGPPKWARIFVAYGTKAECFAHKDPQPKEAPLRNCSGKTKIFEVEIDGIVWYLPTWLHPTDENAAEVFSLNVQLLPVSAAPPSERAKVPDHMAFVFMSRMGSQLALEFGSFEHEEERPKLSDEEYLKTLTEGLGLTGLCLEGVKLFRRCSETTSEQREALPLPKSRTEGEEQAKARAPAKDTAHKLWYAMLPLSISKGWQKKIQQDRVAAGLRAPGHFNPDELGFRIRISPEEYENWRGFDYALIDENDHPSAEEADWLPLPEEAFDPKWVRTGVNLMRYAVYRDLFTKDDWPPWPASLMIQKMGEARGEI